MRNLRQLDKFRVPMAPDYAASMGLNPKGNDENGAFVVPFNGRQLRVLAANGAGWDHVSVSLADRLPTWDEMSFIHRLFFKLDETAWEYHVPLEDHINIHPHVLHLWRKHGFKMPMPPKEFV